MKLSRMKHSTPLGLVSALLLGLLSSLSSLSSLSIGAESRPNILFLFADDWGRYASILQESEGPGTINDVVRTPHIDEIARQGVFFRNAHVSAPSCTPCRSALLTGQHFWRTGSGSILSGAVWDPTLPSFPLLIQDAGYRIGYAHKVWGPGTPPNSPFTPDQAYQKRGNRFNQFSQNATAGVAAGKTVEEAKSEILAEARGNFADFLRGRKEGQPWFFWFGPTNTHRKWTKGSGKALWDIDPDDLKGKMPPFLPDVPEVREDLADYFGEVAALDAGIGVILEELKSSGEWDHTIIVISGDHGAPGFLHGKCNLYDFGTNVCLSFTGPGIRGGRILDDLVSLTDLAPTFLESAGLTPPDTMTGRSLWPSLRSDVAKGVADTSRTQVFTGRERHVDRARADYTPYPQRAIRTKDYTLIINFRPDRYPLGDPYRLDGNDEPTVDELENETYATLPDEDASPTKSWVVRSRKQPEWKIYYERAYGKRPRIELYDVRSDPSEVENVADDPSYTQIRAELEQKLMGELEGTGDPRTIDGGNFYETPPMTGPAKRVAGARKGKGPSQGKGASKGKARAK